jgi:hypothetical protein
VKRDLNSIGTPRSAVCAWITSKYTHGAGGCDGTAFAPFAAHPRSDRRRARRKASPNKMPLTRSVASSPVEISGRVQVLRVIRLVQDPNHAIRAT